MSESVKRPYASPRRREQADETRQRIIRAAHDLFAGQGYSRTTIARIATEAGVAVETVYAAFRNKPALLRQVWYVSFRGDEQDVRLLHRPEVLALFAEPDLAARFDKHAVLLSTVYRRFAPILQAVQGAAGEPAATELLAEWDTLRLDACTRYAEAAAATGQLAVDTDECRDVLFATMDGSLWRQLVTGLGWDDERFAAWLGRLWRSMLVAPPTSRA